MFFPLRVRRRQTATPILVRPEALTAATLAIQPTIAITTIIAATPLRLSLLTLARTAHTINVRSTPARIYAQATLAIRARRYQRISVMSPPLRLVVTMSAATALILVITAERRIPA